MGPMTTIPLSNRVDDSCGGGVSGPREKGTRQRGRVRRGWAGWKGVLIGLPSHGVRVCLQGKVTGGNRSNEV